MTILSNRTCYRCWQLKPAEAFTRRIDDRHYAMCRACVSEIITTRNGPKKRRLSHTALERICYLCRRTLPNGQFTKRSNGTYFSACKDCNRHVFAQRRRARLNAADGSYSLSEWQALVALYEHCPLCLRPWFQIPPPARGGSVITADHIVAIARGGSNRIENIQPLCYSCNHERAQRI
jgi:hypothetical protein